MASKKAGGKRQRDDGASDRIVDGRGANWQGGSAIASFNTSTIVEVWKVLYTYGDVGLAVVGRAVFLMFPTALLSGALFTLLGQALHEQVGSEARAAGNLALWNTIGAMVGASAAGFILLPHVGMEKSLFLLATGYGAVALLCLPRGWSGARRLEIGVLSTAAPVFLLAAVAFPFGLMENHLFRLEFEHFRPRVAQNTQNGEGAPPHDCTLVTTKEGLNETIFYFRHDFLGEPFAWYLATNGHPMASTNTHSKQYMKMFVYLPVALHPAPKRALLISFGTGSTAKALTDTAGLENIDIVDISKDVLNLSELVYPDPADHPLTDPRVQVFIEDGRFFLQTTERQYDLITAEPPPPANAGVVNLYTKEYFKLIHDRLAPGGMATYWLPHENLSKSSFRSIVRAFADVFPDSSLWLGSGMDWIILGIKEGGRRVTEEEFARQWGDPVVGPEMRSLCFESPEHLGAYFVADVEQLHAPVSRVEPLVDDFPHRLSPHVDAGRPEPLYGWCVDPGESRNRFASSRHIHRHWPESVRAKSLPLFDFRLSIHDAMSLIQFAPPDREGLAGIHHLLSESPLRTAVLWSLGSRVQEMEIVSRIGAIPEHDGFLHAKLGDRALADRDYQTAARHYAKARQADLPDQRILYTELLALSMAGRPAEAQRLADEMFPTLPDNARWESDLAFLNSQFGLKFRRRSPSARTMARISHE